MVESPAAKPARLYSSEKDAQRLVSEWQQTLRLTHWDSSVRFATPEELGKTEEEDAKFAETDCRVVNRFFSMLLLPEEQYPEGILSNKDSMEQTVVHELLHVWLSEYVAASGEAEDCVTDLQEGMIDSLARALVKLHRGV